MEPEVVELNGLNHFESVLFQVTSMMMCDILSEGSSEFANQMPLQIA